MAYILLFRKWQLKSDGKSNRCGLARLVELVTADLREEFPVNICLLVALCVRHAAFVNLPQQHLGKALIDLFQCIVESCRLSRSSRHRDRWDGAVRLHLHRRRMTREASALPSGRGTHSAQPLRTRIGMRLSIAVKSMM